MSDVTSTSACQIALFSGELDSENGFVIDYPGLDSLGQFASELNEFDDRLIELVRSLFICLFVVGDLFVKLEKVLRSTL